MSWPTCQPAAFHGLAGDLVAELDPHTEADPLAVLAQFLAAFGNALGRGPGFTVGRTRHYTNLYVVAVGQTSKGRKGTSVADATYTVRAADPPWEKRVTSGLSSAEGLIHEVRDERREKRVAKKNETDLADADGWIEETVDFGVQDKRLLVIEPEFASLLRRMRREGNTISPVIREGYDGGVLRTMTKNAPEKATEALISIVGHITDDELRRELTATDAGNGFANRFLYVMVKRSKELPDGGDLPDAALAPFVAAVRDALTFGCERDVLTRDDEARELWHAVYHDLSAGRPGMVGAVTGRAEAHTMRLAVIYALLDRSAVIGRRHLDAALAVWSYCEQSAEIIFGSSLGDPVADRVLGLLRDALPGGLTGTELYNALGRHDGARIAPAAELLVERGLVYGEDEQTGGRPRHRYFAVEVGAPEAPDAPEARHRAHQAHKAQGPQGDQAHKAHKAQGPQGGFEPSDLIAPDAAENGAGDSFGAGDRHWRSAPPRLRLGGLDADELDDQGEAP